MTVVLCPLCRCATAGRTPVDRAIRAAALAFEVSEADIRSRIRTKHVALARHVVVRALRLTGRSYPELGRDLGYRDHTMAREADRKIAALVPHDARLREIVESVHAAVIGRGVYAAPSARVA